MSSEPFIDSLDIITDSPNAEEALTILSIPLPVTKAKVQAAASAFIKRCPIVVIRCGELGAFIQGTQQIKDGCWIAAFWNMDSAGQVVDVTGTLARIYTSPLLTGC